jgi:hypothetical protein
MTIDTTRDMNVQARADGYPAPRWMVMIVILVALAVRGRAVTLLAEPVARDRDGYLEIAARLQGGEFALLKDGVAGPTAYRPPLYPVVLALWSVVANFELLHFILGLGTVWGAWRLGELSGLPPLASLSAAVLVAVDPILINQSAQPMSETLAAFLATWALVALARFGREASLPHGVLAGAALGLCVLCRPTFLAWAVAVVIALVFRLPTVRRRAVGLSLVVVAEAAAIVAPWPLRNWERFGVPIVTTTHGGYTLLLANNPDFYEYLRRGAWGSTWDAEAFHRRWADEARATMRSNGTALERDELAADARAYELAWQNIKNGPAMFVYSCVVRVGRLWAVLPHQPSSAEPPSRRVLRYLVAVFYAAEYALAAVGLWTLGRKLLVSPWIWSMLLLASFTAVHSLYWTDMRMRAPVVCVVALLAAAGLTQLAAGRRAVKPVAQGA